MTFTCIVAVIALIHALSIGCASNVGSMSHEPYRDLSFEEVNSRLAALRGAFAAVETASDLYHVRNASKVSKDRTILTCSPLIARITDVGSVLADFARPQVFISGEIHGDERVVSIVYPLLALLSVMCSSLLSDRDQERRWSLQSCWGGARTVSSIKSTRAVLN